MDSENTPRENGEQQGGQRAWTSRRRFLEAAGVAGLVGGVGGFAIGQQQSTTYEFGGEVAGWQGRAPPAIEGEVNPTLQLEAGTEYEVVWENLDGVPHDFTIQDDQGNNLASTETMSEQGATRSLTFTASEEMSQYICTIHPTSMVGDVEIGGGQGTEQTPTPEQPRFVPRGPTVGAQLVVDGPLVNPVNLRTVPGRENTHVIADQIGRIYVLQNDELLDEPFLDITEQVMVLADTDGNFDRPEGFDERGLLGVDFHPNFQENGKFYVRYSSAEPSGQTLVGPGDRQLPDDWDHVAVLSEFTVAGAGMGTPTETGTATGNETATGNATETDVETDTGTATAPGASAGGQLQASPDSERILLEVPQPQFNHNAGEVAFGPDGYLYTSLGDGGGADDDYLGHVPDWYDQNEGGNGQDVTENLLGSILRIDVDQQDGNLPYAVPDDNPLVGTDGFDEQYAWGFRNPWRMSFNDEMLITADVGQALFEEVDLVERGGNYGWNVREGFHCFDAAEGIQVPDQCPTSAPEQAPFNGQPLSDPQLEYPHSYQGNQVGISVTGGYVYQGDQLSDLSGQYVFGDWSASFTQPQGRVFVANIENQDVPTATDGQTTGGTTATEMAGNETTGNETTGNETTTEPTGTETTTPGVEEQVDLMQPSEQPWPYQEVIFEGGENGMLNRFVQAFGRDDQGNVYVLASRTGRLVGEAGEVYRLVPAGEGEQITPPPTPTPEGGAAVNETTAGNETTAMNETTAGNETNGNQTGD